MQEKAHKFFNIYNLSVHNNSLTLTKNGIISITTANSILGLENGDKTKFLTLSQTSSCTNNVVINFTIAINPIYIQV